MTILSLLKRFFLFRLIFGNNKPQPTLRSSGYIYRERTSGYANAGTPLRNQSSGYTSYGECSYDCAFDCDHECEYGEECEHEYECEYKHHLEYEQEYEDEQEYDYRPSETTSYGYSQEYQDEYDKYIDDPYGYRENHPDCEFDDITFHKGWYDD